MTDRCWGNECGSGYTDIRDFYEACLGLRQDEEDGSGPRPALMFQYWECIPDFLISESSLNEYGFQYMQAVTGMDDDRANSFEMYCKLAGRGFRRSARRI